jgi:hypothetical protein
MIVDAVARVDVVCQSSREIKWGGQYRGAATGEQHLRCYGSMDLVRQIVSYRGEFYNGFAHVLFFTLFTQIGV